MMKGLFASIKLDTIELRNRIVLPPMATEKSTEEGLPTEELYEHYEERSKGPGLVIVEHSYVDEGGRLSKNQLGIYSDEHIEPLQILADLIKENGAAAAIQINHAGGKAQEEMIGKKPVAPSEAYFENAEELCLKEMEEIKAAFREAARRAEEAGFDAVEVHGAHGFLLGQFLSPISNQRKDGYGGEDLEKRMKFPLEVVEEVKRVLDDTALFYRLGATDRDEEGLTVNEAKIFAKELQERGVEVIDVSGNLCGSRPSDLEGEQGYFVSTAMNVKRAVDVPVIGVGGIKDPDHANKIVEEGMVDMVAVGREQWKDPRWAFKAKEEIGE